MQYTWTPPTIPFLSNNDQFMVRRVYCIGRNYRSHAIEMGSPDAEPFYFCKTSDCVTPCDGHTSIPYPPGTSMLHHEVELVVALGGSGAALSAEQAAGFVVGYGVGIDFTRRDLQSHAKSQRRPWTSGKNFANAAVVSKLLPSSNIHAFARGRIALSVNGERRQDADLNQLIWPLSTIIQRLSTINRLEPGDLVFTGTPAGVSSVQPGDHIAATIAGLPSLSVEITPPR